jgi:hypothetical protein
VAVRRSCRGPLHNLLRIASGRGGSFCVFTYLLELMELDLLSALRVVNPVKQIKYVGNKWVVFANELAIKRKFLSDVRTFSLLVKKFFST